jgi:ribokinase
MIGLRGPDFQAELVLRHALEKLRARDGLSLTRLQAAANGIASPLLTLPAVTRYSTDHDVDIPRAALALVGETVRDALTGTDRIVADAVLALGTLIETYDSCDIDRRAIADIRSSLLSRRRRTLLRYWHDLHAALGVVPIGTPSDRKLRGSLEGVVLAELARLLVRSESSPTTPHGNDFVSQTRPATPASPQRRTDGRVIVVGGAVMDATFKTKVLPQRETSSEAHDFDLAPGGKGLTQAVAAARLGLDVSLLAAVADDGFGQEIVGHLQRENVDTSLLKIVKDARTPFTGIIEFELGDSIAVNWRNDREVRLDLRDVEQARSDLLSSDAVLITFELPRDSMQRVLSFMDRAHTNRPVVIVTPGQPYATGGISGQALAQIDFMVAHAWELGSYAPHDRDALDIDAVARRLLAYGVETLCIPTGNGSKIYSETPLGTFTVPTFPSTYKETSAARDAFCAALAAKLIDSDRRFSENVALWATAAMAAAAADHPLPNSMPNRQRVEQLLSRSRFSVTPRAADFNGVGGAALTEEPVPSPPPDADSRLTSQAA